MLPNFKLLVLIVLSLFFTSCSGVQADRNEEIQQAVQESVKQTLTQEAIQEGLKYKQTLEALQENVQFLETKIAIQEEEQYAMTQEAIALMPNPTITPYPRKNQSFLEPIKGVYFGANVDWGVDTPRDFNRRLGSKAAVFVQFLKFPLDEQASQYLDLFLLEVGQQGAIAFLTFEPTSGLDTVTEETAHDLAARLSHYNLQGIPIFVLFAHEMNGTWYKWSSQPSLYKEKYRMVADYIHRVALRTAMVWAPNYGGGYPFSGGLYEVKPDDPDFDLLDTNGDGRLSMADDMYSPYYPGDDYVDWVGFTIYHWGSNYPWGENEVPEHGKFVSMITGNYDGFNGDHREVLDFYNEFSIRHNKPMAITETGAFFNTEVSSGDSEFAIKHAWWNQVYSAQIFQSFPRIKMINWFDIRKNESEVRGSFVDWSLTYSPLILDAFLLDLPYENMIFADEIPFK